MDNHRLGDFFHFNDFDLHANCSGKLSENQIKRLTTAAKVGQKSARDSATILFVIAAAGLTVGLIVGVVAPTLLSRILILLLMDVLWTFAWAGRGLKILRDALVLQEPHLDSIGGRVHLKHTDEDYVLQVGDKEFDLEGNPAGMIMEGGEYTVYYVAETDEILSLEYAARSNT